MDTNTRNTWIAVIIVIIIAVIGGWYLLAHNTAVAPTGETGQASSDETSVRNVVTDFGTKLQMVSISGPSDAAAAAIAANYGADVAPSLLAKWEADPGNAPGRVTSSPWPDRIEIGSVAKNPDGSYAVAGDVIEVTSVQKAQGGVNDTYPISLTVSNVNGAWLITDVTTGDVNPAAAGPTNG
jgi:hypothetical protein